MQWQARKPSWMWHSHFLLWPKKIGRKWVWLETVQRRRPSGISTLAWHYRIPTTTDILLADMEEKRKIRESATGNKSRLL